MQHCPLFTPVPNQHFKLLKDKTDNKLIPLKQFCSFAFNQASYFNPTISAYSNILMSHF